MQFQQFFAADGPPARQFILFFYLPSLHRIFFYGPRGKRALGPQFMQFQWHTMSFIWQMAKWQKAARKYADKEETYHLEFIDKGLDRSWGFGQMAKWQKAKAGGLRQLGQRATTWCAQTALCRGKAGRGNRKTAPRRALQDGRCQIF